MFQSNSFKRIRLLWVLLAAGAMLSACSVSTHKDDNDEDKKVDIKMPFAQIHVGSDTSASDAGLALYPGARPKEGDNDKHRANLQIGGEDFGIKVIAATYDTDDSPQKVIDFYRKDLKRYGKVLECPKGLSENHDDKDDEIRCDTKGDEEAGKLDLAVGVPERQHIVSVKANGKGTEFSTVYVNVKGKDKGTM
jgi:hypothetical protein